MTSTRALIHLDNFRHNIQQLQGLAEGRPLCLAVKADAYGHGAPSMVREAEALGVRHFGVSRIIEARRLREAGCESSLLLFSAADPEDLPLLWELDIQPFVPDSAYLALLRSARPSGAGKIGAGKGALRVHIKTDTGMGRLGCPPEQVPALAEEISRDPLFIAEGLATHFPLSDDPFDPFTSSQISDFMNLAEELHQKGLCPPLVHASNSGGILFHDISPFSLLRPGIAAYGYAPDPAFDSELQQRGIELKPVMELRAPISFIKEFPAGRPLSYGHIWTSPHPCWIGTVNAGYADGYQRALSGKARILVDGRSYPQVGRICMDQCMVYLGEIQEGGTDEPPLPRNTEAVLFGPSPEGESAASLAELAGTIAYEITCGISSRVARVYLNSSLEKSDLNASAE